MDFEGLIKCQLCEVWFGLVFLCVLVMENRVFFVLVLGKHSAIELYQQLKRLGFGFGFWFEKRHI